MRPVLEPEANTVTASTAGFSPMRLLTSCRMSVIAGNEMSSTASATTMIWPRSSVGKKPFGIATKSATEAASEPAATPITTARRPRHQSSAAAYRARVQRKPASNHAVQRRAGSSSRWRRRKREPSIGMSVRDTSAETRIASETTTANSWKSPPITPGMKKMGMNTATRESEMETMVKPISFDPLRAARIGDSPASTWRTMFSSITMASSTTRPTASVMPRSETLSSV